MYGGADNGTFPSYVWQYLEAGNLQPYFSIFLATDVLRI